MNKAQTKRKLVNKKWKWKWIIVITIFISLLLGWVLLDRWSSKYGFTGAGDFVKNITTNYWSSFDAKYESIEITMNESDYSDLESQREKHLKRGIITKLDERYVKAIITHNGKKIKCKLRLKGHMLDHLQESKWSFRVKTVAGDAFKGMKIFSLMHPGTRNYIYEWIYHQLLKQEGIPTIRYSFLHLKVNGENWGIYAVEENFASELLDHNELPDGPIFGFNPDLYWNARLNGFDKKKLDMQDLLIHSSMIEGYDEKELFKSEEKRNNYVEAIIRIEQFRRGELTTSQVFDINKLAKFHAILDLVGGQFSLDWSDVKYYYNPITQKVEPVGYESFSVKNTAQLAGASKYMNKFDHTTEWHDRLFSDKDFFKLYLQELKRISNPKYLDKFFSKNDNELRNNLSILFVEFPYKKLSLKQYYTNQLNILSLLKTPLIPFVFLEKVESDSLYFTVGCNSSLPIQIHEIKFGEKVIKVDNMFISARGKFKPVVFERHVIPIPDSLLKGDTKNMIVVAGYPGMKERKDIEVKPIPFTGDLIVSSDFINQSPNYTNFDFIKVDEEKKQILISSGEHVVNENIFFPSGYQIIGNSPLRLVLNNNAYLISKSGFKLNGSEDEPIVIKSEDSTGGGLILLNTTGGSHFKYVDFENIQSKSKKENSHNSVILSYESGIKLISCRLLSDAKIGLKCIRSRCVLENTEFHNFTDKALEVNFSDIKFNSILFTNCKKEAIDLNSCNGKINQLKILNSGTGLRVDNASVISVQDSEMKDLELGFYCTDNSILKITRVDLNKLKAGFRAEKKSDVYGSAVIKVSGLKKVKVSKLSEFDKKSKVIIE